LPVANCLEILDGEDVEVWKFAGGDDVGMVAKQTDVRGEEVRRPNKTCVMKLLPCNEVEDFRRKSFARRQHLNEVSRLLFPPCTLPVFAGLSRISRRVVLAHHGGRTTGWLFDMIFNLSNACGVRGRDESIRHGCQSSVYGVFELGR